MTFSMATRDVRKERPEVIQELRQRAVELKTQGFTHGAVAGMLNVSVSASRLWWKIYQDGGSSSLTLGQRGRPTGACRVLDQKQEKIVIRAITDKTPEQLKLPFVLWTSPVVQRFIHERLGILLPIRTLRLYLKRWGFTPQRPKKIAYERPPGEVRKWMEETYPALAKRAKSAKADILWGDETGISNQDHSGRGYSPVGVTPAVRGMARRATTSMISAIGNRGDMRFMIYKGGLKADTFIRFLGRLVQSAKRKIFLIVDNLRVHKAMKVREWVGARSHQIELFFLPPYSPDFNPDEYLNNPIKAQLRNHPVAATHTELKARLGSKMKSNQRKPDLIRSLFRHPRVAYAA
ncbi:MAG: IS630 family transposase [Bergeyella sp.]